MQNISFKREKNNKTIFYSNNDIKHELFNVYLKI